MEKGICNAQVRYLIRLSPSRGLWHRALRLLFGLRIRQVLQGMRQFLSLLEWLKEPWMFAAAMDSLIFLDKVIMVRINLFMVLPQLIPKVLNSLKAQ